MAGHEQNSGVGSLSESMSEADSDMNMTFLKTSDSNKIMSMNTDVDMNSENKTTLNGTNCEFSADVPDCHDCFDFNGVPVVFSPINVNYNGKCFQSA